MVERSIAWLIGPKGRSLKRRYHGPQTALPRAAKRHHHGVNANDRWLHTRMAALNLRRPLTLDLRYRNCTWTIPHAPT